VWGIAPGEFWQMTPTEWAWLYAQKAGPQMVGKLTVEQAEELYQMA